MLRSLAASSPSSSSSGGESSGGESSGGVSSSGSCALENGVFHCDAEQEYEHCHHLHNVPWFACVDLTAEFGWFLLVMIVLLLLSAGLEHAFERLEHLESFRGELFARVKSELTILGSLSFVMFAVVAADVLEGYRRELVEFVHFMLFIAALFYCVLVLGFLVIRSKLSRMYQTHHAWLREATPEQLQELADDTPRALLRCFAALRSLDQAPSTQLRGDARRPNVSTGSAADAAAARPMRSSQVRALCKLLVAKRALEAQWEAVGAPLPADFDHASHLLRSLDAVLVNVVQLNPVSWVLVLALFALCYGLGTLLVVAAWSYDDERRSMMPPLTRPLYGLESPECHDVELAAGAAGGLPGLGGVAAVVGEEVGSGGGATCHGNNATRHVRLERANDFNLPLFYVMELTNWCFLFGLLSWAVAVSRRAFAGLHATPEVAAVEPAGEDATIEAMRQMALNSQVRMTISRARHNPAAVSGSMPARGWTNAAASSQASTSWADDDPPADAASAAAGLQAWAMLRGFKPQETSGARMGQRLAARQTLSQRAYLQRHSVQEGSGSLNRHVASMNAAADGAVKTPAAFWALFPLHSPYLLVRAFQTQALALAFGVAQYFLLYVWTSNGLDLNHVANVVLYPVEFVFVFAPIMLNNMALFFSVGPLADASSVAEAMTMTAAAPAVDGRPLRMPTANALVPISSVAEVSSPVRTASAKSEERISSAPDI